MTIYIDTTDFGKVVFTIDGSNRKIKKSFPVSPQESFKILDYLDKFLKQSKVKKSEIKKIAIYKGKGSFTGLRVGSAIAQGLSLAWKVPVKVITKK
jgi:tRNA threonylcarbamoyladenosine biosynthesis protein TsaB